MVFPLWEKGVDKAWNEAKKLINVGSSRMRGEEGMNVVKP